MTRVKKVLTSALGALLLAATGGGAQAGWTVGVRVGAPVYYRPYGPYYYPYYPYGTVYVAPPPPVVVESAPVLVQPALSVQPVYPAAAAPAAPPTVVRTQAPEAASPSEIAHYLQQLRDPDERARAESVMQLGRLRALAGIDPLAATLAGDRSPLVREAAARGLGLIGSPKALPALQHAAMADPDRDVRHSAQFAAEVVQSGR